MGRPGAECHGTSRTKVAFPSRTARPSRRRGAPRPRSPGYKVPVRFRLVSLFALTAALVPAAQSRAAAQPDPVAVGRADTKATRGFSTSLAVQLVAPDGYERGCCYDS